MLYLVGRSLYKSYDFIIRTVVTSPVSGDGKYGAVIKKGAVLNVVAVDITVEPVEDFCGGFGFKIIAPERGAFTVTEIVHIAAGACSPNRIGYLILSAPAFACCVNALENSFAVSVVGCNANNAALS